MIIAYFIHVVGYENNHYTWRQFLFQLTGYYQNLRVEKNVIAMRLQPFGMKDSSKLNNTSA